MTKITSWGKYPLVDVQVYSPLSSQQLADYRQTAIAYGLGRSYGDSALADHIVVTKQMNHFIKFDEQAGILTCEAGVSLDEILKLIVVKGWFLPVTPGTKFVTVGGAIASDVHGKNHHLDGSFSDHVLALTLTVQGKEVICSPENNSELFHATCGGMGLTGMISQATFRLKAIKSAYINQKVIKAENLDAVLALFEQYQETTYSVAWIDCLSTGRNLGRSLLMLGEHAQTG